MTRGGQREGAGRKPAPKIPENGKVKFERRVSLEEYEKLKEFLQELRKGEEKRNESSRIN
jgi:hypothetical protein